MLHILHRVITDHMRIHPLGYLLLDTIKCSSADEQDVTRVYMDVILIRMLASPLGRHIDHRTLQKFQQTLLYPFPAHVTRDGRIITLTGYLVDFVDKDNTPLSSLYIIIGYLQQTGKNTLYVLPYIAGLGKHRSIHYRERHMQ